MDTLKKPSDATLQTEYNAAQIDYLHNDNFPWQIGTILVAGTFILWGILIENPASEMNLRIFGVASLLVTILLSAWIIFYHHYRQAMLYKLDRLQEIERELGMDSHLRWVFQGQTKPKYKNFGPSGHAIAIFVYCITALGAPLIGFLKNDFRVSLWFVCPLVVVVITIGVFWCIEKRLKDSLGW